MPRQYFTELRRRVIDLIEGGRSVVEVAALVQPSQQTICAWWNQHLVDTGRKAGTPTVESTQLLAAHEPGQPQGPIIEPQQMWGPTNSGPAHQPNCLGVREPFMVIEPAVPPIVTPWVFRRFVFFER